MPVKHKPGKVIKGYTLKNLLSNGAYAFAYEAEKKGRKIFFKQYKSPAPAIEWFDGYKSYATEIKNRIQGDDAARTRCYEMIEFFEEKDFFQAFEFVEGGMDLLQVVKECDTYEWPQLVTFAKILMSAMDALHQIGIVHTDLKPENIYLIPDPTIGIGYRLRIIDLDFAILADKPAPWLGHMGFVGTDGYRSPEHIRAQTPSAASDVFTCGIMLAQLLCGWHPFAECSADQIDAATLAGRAKPFQITRPIPKVDDVAFLQGVLDSALCPDPAKRPTAKQVSQALLGKTFAWTPWRTPLTPPPPAPADLPQPETEADISFSYEGTPVLRVGVDSKLGKNHFIKVHEDAKFLSNPQFRVFKNAGKWMISHESCATNATLLEGAPLLSPTPLASGMVVAVGNPEKKISKFPLKIEVSR